MCLKVPDAVTPRSGVFVAEAHMPPQTTQRERSMISQAQTNPQRAFFEANIRTKTNT
jgi:hypothetical protein